MMQPPPPNTALLYLERRSAARSCTALQAGSTAALSPAPKPQCQWAHPFAYLHVYLYRLCYNTNNCCCALTVL